MPTRSHIREIAQPRAGTLPVLEDGVLLRRVSDGSVLPVPFDGCRRESCGWKMMALARLSTTSDITFDDISGRSPARRDDNYLVTSRAFVPVDSASAWRFG